MTQNATLAERMAVIATIDPDAYGTGDQNTDVIDMQYWQEVMFVVAAGTIASTGTLNFGVYGDTASNGSFATLITGKEITQLTEAGTDSDKQAVINVTAEEARAQGFRYLRGKLTLAAAGADAGVVVLASPGRYSDARDYDLASVDEVVL